MSVSTTFDFSSASIFSLDQAIVHADEGSLDHEDTESDWIEDFADDTDFTYDNTKAEFIGGLVRSIDNRPANSVLAATYTSSKDLSWSASGSLVGTDIGTPVLSGGKLQCHGGGNSAVRYENADIGSPGNVGAFKIKYTPNYSGTPVANFNIFEFAPVSGNNDKMLLLHSASGGTLRLTAYTSAGTVKHSAAVFGAAWSPVAGTEYELELNWDTIAGQVRLFVDGVLQGAMPVSSYARGTDADMLYIGAGTVYTAADAAFNDAILFSTVQHTSGYTPGYTVPEYIYATSKIDLPTYIHGVAGQDISSITSFIPIEAGSPRYTVEGKYHNGSDWVVSNGSYAQANSSATVQANIATLGFLTGDNTIDVSVIFPDSNTLSSIDNLTVGHMAGVHFSTGSIETATALSIQEIESFSASVTEPANTTIRFQLRIDGTLKYWNGSSWVASDGTTTQGNTATEINSNVSSLNLGSNSSIKLRIALATSDETISPSISSMTIVYDFGGILDGPQTCIVWGYYLDISGAPVSGAEITFQLSRSKYEYKEANGNIIEKKVVVTTDSNGYFETELIRSSEYEGSGTYTLSIAKTSDVLNTSKTSSGSSIDFTVPDAIDKNLTDLLIES